MKEKKRSAFSWILEWAGQKRSAYVWSVVLAAGSVIFKVIPYFMIADVVKMFLDGNREFKTYLVRQYGSHCRLSWQNYYIHFRRHFHIKPHLQCLQI